MKYLLLILFLSSCTNASDTKTVQKYIYKVYIPQIGIVECDSLISFNEGPNLYACRGHGVVEVRNASNVMKVLR